MALAVTLAERDIEVSPVPGCLLSARPHLALARVNEPAPSKVFAVAILQVTKKDDVDWQLVIVQIADDAFGARIQL
jgi:hypothetical protein